MSEITRLLDSAAAGDRQAAAEILPLVYEELRKLAASKMAAENAGQTLQATALVHEAYLRLVGGEQARDWDGRRHFFAAAAEAMRRILVENARRRHRIKRGGRRARVDLDAAQPVAPESDDKLLALDEALEKLALKDPVKAELVRLRVFVGLNLAEAAEILGLSKSTADRYWAYARAWLRVQIAGPQSTGSEPGS